MKPLPPIKPGRYRHYKGGEYEVVGVVRHSESLEPMVLYRPLHQDSGDWVRPHAMFLESVEHQGKTVPRFELVADTEPVVGPNTVCLWFNGTAEAAARFYAATFPNSAVRAVHRAPGDFPSGRRGDVLTVEFNVLGIPCLGLNGGPAFEPTEAFSFQVATQDQAETDRYWDAIVNNGGRESACGWCKDRWGVSWQITPVALTRAITHPDPAAAQRAFQAMMTMRRIDIAAIEAAVRG